MTRILLSASWLFDSRNPAMTTKQMPMSGMEGGNPFSDDEIDSLPVRVLRQLAPQAGIDVLDVREKPDQRAKEAKRRMQTSLQTMGLPEEPTLSSDLGRRCEDAVSQDGAMEVHGRVRGGCMGGPRRCAVRRCRRRGRWQDGVVTDRSSSVRTRTSMAM